MPDQDMTAHWERRLDRLETKLDTLNSSLSALNGTLVRQEGTLEEHIRRTEALEEGLDLVRVELKPLSTATAVWALIPKVVLLVTASAGAITAAFKLLSYFGH